MPGRTFPHSMAKAVVRAAKEHGLDHEEMHSKVEYIVAHGISSSVEGKKVIIGSSHLSLMMKDARLRKDIKKHLRLCPRSILIYIWRLKAGWQP